jgi:hypothetical protein
VEAGVDEGVSVAELEAKVGVTMTAEEDGDDGRAEVDGWT